MPDGQRPVHSRLDWGRRPAGALHLYHGSSVAGLTLVDPRRSRTHLGFGPGLYLTAVPSDALDHGRSREIYAVDVPFDPARSLSLTDPASLQNRLARQALKLAVGPRNQSSSANAGLIHRWRGRLAAINPATRRAAGDTVIDFLTNAEAAHLHRGGSTGKGDVTVDQRLAAAWRVRDQLAMSGINLLHAQPPMADDVRDPFGGKRCFIWIGPPLASRPFLTADQLRRLQDLHTRSLARVCFHITPAANLQSIRQNGLMPALGRRARDGNEQAQGTFLFADQRHLLDGVATWVEYAFGYGQALALLAVGVQEEEAEVDPNHEFEVVVRGRIGPERVAVLAEHLAHHSIDDISHLATMAVTPLRRREGEH